MLIDYNRTLTLTNLELRYDTVAADGEVNTAENQHKTVCTKEETE